MVTIFSSNDANNPKQAALDMLNEAVEAGYDRVLESHKKTWDKMWEHYDIKVEGNLRDMTLTRFNLYHNIIHTPTHAYLPIGARGLSCQAYQGAAFWDQKSSTSQCTSTRSLKSQNILYIATRQSTAQG